MHHSTKARPHIINHLGMCLLAALLLTALLPGSQAWGNPAKITAKITASAEQGNPDDQYRLGRMYFQGTDVKKDTKTGVMWITKAADQGHARAQHTLANLYAKGIGVTRDLVQSAKWYQKAAEQGMSLAQYNLARMYHGGHGVKQDIISAARWYAKSAEQGNPHAQYRLGLMYDKGEGVAHNHQKAGYWLTRAANQAHPRALYSLGILHLYDLVKMAPEPHQHHSADYGLAKDFVEASLNLTLAAKYGDSVLADNARRVLEDIRPKMTPKQIAKAKKSAENWRPTYESSQK